MLLVSQLKLLSRSYRARGYRSCTVANRGLKRHQGSMSCTCFSRFLSWCCHPSLTASLSSRISHSNLSIRSGCPRLVAKMGSQSLSLSLSLSFCVSLLLYTVHCSVAIPHFLTSMSLLRTLQPSVSLFTSLLLSLSLSPSVCFSRLVSLSL